MQTSCAGPSLDNQHPRPTQHQLRPQDSSSSPSPRPQIPNPNFQHSCPIVPPPSQKDAWWSQNFSTKKKENLTSPAESEASHVESEREKGGERERREIERHTWGRLSWSRRIAEEDLVPLFNAWWEECFLSSYSRKTIFIGKKNWREYTHK